jgi:hypothetical protein
MKTDIEIKQMYKHFFSIKKHKSIKNINEDYENEKREEEKTWISKIYPCHFFSINEIQLSEIIEQIPYFSNYYDVLYDYDFIKIGQMNDNYKSIEKTVVDIKEKYLLFEFKKRNFIKFNHFWSLCKNPKQLILHTFDSFSHLLNSLIKLQENNICFFNLSSENIVFDMDCGEKPILINFQKSLHTDKMDETYIKNIIGKSSSSSGLCYTCKPLEVHVLFYIICNNLNTISHTLIEEITETYMKNLSILNFFSLSFKENFKLSCVLSLEKYINKPKTYIIKDIIERKKVITWDSYSLSIIYLHIFGNMLKVFNLKDTCIGKLTILLSKNINPDYTKRDSLNKIQENVDKLFCQYHDWVFVKTINTRKMNLLFNILSE